MVQVIEKYLVVSLSLGLLLSFGGEELAAIQPQLNGHSKSRHFERKKVLVGTDLLLHTGARDDQRSEKLGVSLATLRESQLEKLSHYAHRFGRCGGFEVLDADSLFLRPVDFLGDLEKRVERDEQFQDISGLFRTQVEENEMIRDAVYEIDPGHIRETVKWLSSYKTRYHRSSSKNAHVHDLEGRLEKMIGRIYGHQEPSFVEVDVIEHKKTPQKSVRVRVVGRKRPKEKVILGGHLDSVVGWHSGDRRAPGADDNASGSASLLEALRVLLQHPRPERTVEFFWYAGEEAGLLGSSEIAKQYNRDDEDVIGALQLDMTAFAGSGEETFVMMTDYTSAWLNQYLQDLNDVYLGLTVKFSRCGYGCSDHASWYRQGFPTVFPHEATFSEGNRKIHTVRDVIENGLDFKHSAIFAKLALIYTLDLANSRARESDFYD